MQFELLLPSSGPSAFFGTLLRCVSEQTIMPIKVSVLWHKEVTEQEHFMFLAKLKLSLKQVQDIMLISNISFPDYIPGRGVGYDRDFLLQQATQDFCYFIDQDNEFGQDHFERIITEYQKMQKEKELQKFILSPTIERRKSGKIQSRGILKMYYMFPKYLFNNNQSNAGWSQVQMIGGNSLFGPTKAMQSIGFDRTMRYFCEDIDFSYRWFQAGNRIVVSHNIRIHHMERDQTPHSSRCLHTSLHAYARSYNRIRFVKKTASSLNKRAYLLCGVWVQTVLFLGLCVIYGREKRWELVRAVWSGTRDGIYLHYLK